VQHKKSLGQNFLKSKGAIGKMVEVSGAKKGETVLEIGPGLGVLTEALLATGANVIAVEKDDRLIPILQEKFEKEISNNQLSLVHGDILDFKNFEWRLSDADGRRVSENFSRNFTRAQRETLGERNFQNPEYRIVANIPYYITGQVIRKFLEAENQPSSMTLLVQKEVAERITAKDGKESLLSLSVKSYGEPKYVKTVKRGSFDPAPNVDSAIIHISDISRKNFRKDSPCESYVANAPEKFEQKFFELLHAGFAHKRKQLLPNLSALYSKDTLSCAFEKLSIPLKSRAEDVSLENWLKLCKFLSPLS
jgi:16S rRNA (adenine1518-N6/adenine1519-N6)-dimethyltransferase